MGALYTCLQRTTYNLNFSEILTKNLLSAIIENTPKGEKSIEKKHTSVNNQQHEKFVRSSLPALDMFD
jgi:hypothetical protein